MRWLGACLANVLVLPGGAPARAAVTIDFYSHELTLVARGLNTYFPHALVILRGTTEDGTPVNTNLGFTAKTVFINILWQKVTGEMDPTPLPPGYLDGADRRFSFPLTDEQYHAVLAVADRWRNAPQPSYDIDESNCVIFIKHVAQAVGLSVSDDKRFVRAPSDFLLDVAQRNAAFLASHGPQPALMLVAGRGGAQAATPSQTQTLQERVRQLEAQSGR